MSRRTPLKPINSIKDTIRNRGSVLEAQLSTFPANFFLELRSPCLYFLLIGLRRLLYEDCTIFPLQRGCICWTPKTAGGSMAQHQDRRRGGRGVRFHDSGNESRSLVSPFRPQAWGHSILGWGGGQWVEGSNYYKGSTSPFMNQAWSLTKPVQCHANVCSFKCITELPLWRMK